MRGIIYKYTAPNGKIYIGQTTNEKKRKKAHKNISYNPKIKDYDTHFHRAIRKYGFDSFKYEVLFWTTSKSEENMKVVLDTLEKFYIHKYNTFDPRFGYNMTKGGDGQTGMAGEKNPFYGHKHSEETRKKLSESHKGKNTWLKGVKLSEEHRKKISESKKGKRTHSQKVLCIETGVIYDAIIDAASAVNGHRQYIRKCCKGTNDQYKGYHWKYVA